MWNSRADTVRDPPEPWITTLARSAANTADRSSLGSAWPSEPPTVPRLRTTGSAMTRSASWKIRKCSPATADDEQLGVAGHRPDPQLVALEADVGELAGEVVDVDEVLGPGEAQLHHREQRVAAGDEPRLGSELLEQGDGVADAGRALVPERCRCLHVPPVSSCPDAPGSAE